MTVLWDSAAFAGAERCDALRETIRANVVRVELDLPSVADQVRARVALSDVACLQICSVDAMPTTVTRTPRLAGADDEEPALFLTLQVSGTSMMVQHGRQAVLRPGQFAVYATTSPYTLMFDSGVRVHFFRIPLSEVALPAAAVGEVSARALGEADDHIGSLTSPYLMRLATTVQLRARPASDLLAVPTIELLRAALTNAMGKGEGDRPAAVGRVAQHRGGGAADPVALPS